MSRERQVQTPEQVDSIEKINQRAVLLRRVSRVAGSAIALGGVGGTIFLAVNGDSSNAVLVGLNTFYLDMWALTLNRAAGDVIKGESSSNNPPIDLKR